MQYLQNASSFLTEAIIGFVLYVILLRFWMQWVRADFRNEIGQFIITVTNPMVIPLRKFIPSVGTIDTATIVLAFVVCIFEIVALFLISAIPAPLSALFPAAVVWAIGLLLEACLYLFRAAIFISIIASWVAPNSYHPALMVARSLSEPILAPARKIIPPLGGIDLSPIVVLLFLQVSHQLLVAPLKFFAI